MINYFLLGTRGEELFVSRRPWSGIHALLDPQPPQRHVFEIKKRKKKKEKKKKKAHLFTLTSSFSEKERVKQLFTDFNFD